MVWQQRLDTGDKCIFGVRAVLATCFKPTMRCWTFKPSVLRPDRWYHVFVTNAQLWVFLHPSFVSGFQASIVLVAGGNIKKKAPPPATFLWTARMMAIHIFPQRVKTFLRGLLLFDQIHFNKPLNFYNRWNESYFCHDCDYLLEVQLWRMFIILFWTSLVSGRVLPMKAVGGWLLWAAGADKACKWPPSERNVPQ